jgi:hypothetical protein
LQRKLQQIQLKTKAKGDAMKKFLISHMWWITLLLALTMLIAHTVSYDIIKVDNISIILLIVMLLSPFTTAITKIRIGDFEAEVNPEEIRRIKEQFEARPKNIDELTELPEMDKTIEGIKSIAKSDPVLALAKLRIELEKVLNKLLRLSRSDNYQEKILSAGQLVYKLEGSGILSSDISAPTRNVIQICNRAIHGEDIREQDAQSVTEIGISLLREISYLVQDYALKPLETEIVDKDILDEFENSKYRVTTIVPLVDKPYKAVRVLDQEGLDELLDGYNEYAEFIVDITKVNTVKSRNIIKNRNKKPSINKGK